MKHTHALLKSSTYFADYANFIKKFKHVTYSGNSRGVEENDVVLSGTITSLYECRVCLYPERVSVDLEQKMYAIKPIPLFKTEFFGATVRNVPANYGGGENEFMQGSYRVGSRVKGAGSIRAVISREDPIVESKQSLEAKEVSGSVASCSSNVKRGIDVRAVVTIRRKMKEKVTEKIEHQWELFMNGIGQGILIRIISEEVDPGLQLFPLFFLLGSFRKSNHVWGKIFLH